MTKIVHSNRMMNKWNFHRIVQSRIDMTTNRKPPRTWIKVSMYLYFSVMFHKMMKLPCNNFHVPHYPFILKSVNHRNRLTRKELFRSLSVSSRLYPLNRLHWFFDQHPFISDLLYWGGSKDWLCDVNRR